MKSKNYHYIIQLIYPSLPDASYMEKKTIIRHTFRVLLKILMKKTYDKYIRNVEVPSSEVPLQGDILLRQFYPTWVTLNRTDGLLLLIGEAIPKKIYSQGLTLFRYENVSF